MRIIYESQFENVVLTMMAFFSRPQYVDSSSINIEYMRRSVGSSLV